MMAAMFGKIADMAELKLLKKIIECDACGEFYEAGSQDFIFDNGWVLDSTRFGYYAGFDDELWPSENEERANWLMCHDCIVMLLEAFPRLGATIGKGAHPCQNDTPCCKWAWRGIDTPNGTTLQYSSDDGEWIDAATT
jgi:hypothetical protein